MNASGSLYDDIILDVDVILLLHVGFPLNTCNCLLCQSVHHKEFVFTACIKVGFRITCQGFKRGQTLNVI